MSEELAVEKKAAYDLGELGSKLKDAGLDLAEVGAAKIAEVVLSWLEESAKNSSNPYDDMALIVMPKLKDYIVSKIEKISEPEASEAPEAPKE